MIKEYIRKRKVLKTLETVLTEGTIVKELKVFECDFNNNETERSVRGLKIRIHKYSDLPEDMQPYLMIRSMTSHIWFRKESWHKLDTKNELLQAPYAEELSIIKENDPLAVITTTKRIFGMYSIKISTCDYTLYLCIVPEYSEII